MKRLALAGTVILTTFVLGIFAVAVAQRDARNRSEEELKTPEYSMQSPDPISARLTSQSDVIPASDIGVPPLDVPPPLSSQTVVRANDQGAAVSNPLRRPDGSAPTFIAPPTLTPAGNGNNSSFSAPSNSLMPPPMLNSTAMPSQGMPPTGMPATGLPTTAPALVEPRNTMPMQSPATASLSSDPVGGLPAPPSAVMPMPPMQTGVGSSGTASTAYPSPNYPPSSFPSSNSNMPPNQGLSSNQGQPASMSGSSPNMVPLGGGLPDRSFSNPPSTLTSTPANTARPSVEPRAESRPVEPRNSASLSEPPTDRGSMSTSRSSNGYSSISTGSNRSGMQSLSSRNLAPSLTQLVAEKPGQRGLDGAQNPSLQLQKRAPEEVQVGQPSTFSLIVRNVGNATAHEVTVLDRVPSGTRFTRSQPSIEPDEQGNLVWSLGEIPAGGEQTIVLELVPETEGEIGSVASVTFASRASVRTLSTQPRLEITQVLDPKVLVGNMLDVRIQIANNGTGIARDIILVEEVPNGLKHPIGPSMEIKAFNLEPGESRTIPLELLATDAGFVQNIVRATAANASPVESISPVQIVAPQLQIALTGPKLRYLERQATYQITVSNPGTSMAHDVDIFASLPRGLRFNNAANDGSYIANKHMVAWNIEELKPGESASTDLVVMPVEEGDFVIRVDSQAKGVKSEAMEKPVRVEGQSELAFSIEDDNDPIETDGFTTYQVKVSNIGTRGDRNVQVAIELPQGSEVLQVNAPVQYSTNASGIVFEPISEMKAKDQQVYRFAVRLPREGTQVVRAHVKSQQRPVAVIKEESTQVYSDK